MDDTQLTDVRTYDIQNKGGKQTYSIDFYPVRTAFVLYIVKGAGSRTDNGQNTRTYSCMHCKFSYLEFHEFLVLGGDLTSAINEKRNDDESKKK